MLVQSWAHLSVLLLHSSISESLKGYLKSRLWITSLCCHYQLYSIASPISTVYSSNPYPLLSEVSMHQGCMCIMASIELCTATGVPQLITHHHICVYHFLSGSLSDRSRCSWNRCLYTSEHSHQYLPHTHQCQTLYVLHIQSILHAQWNYKSVLRNHLIVCSSSQPPNVHKLTSHIGSAVPCII